jgi:hypothetical protein
VPETAAAMPCSKWTYLNTKTVCIASGQQPDTVVSESIEELLEQVGLLLLSLLLKSSIAAIRGVLHQHSIVMDSTVAREKAVTTYDRGKASLSDKDTARNAITKALLVSRKACRCKYYTETR